MAAGDIACSPGDAHFNGGKGIGRYCRAAAVAKLAGRLQPAAFLALGDEQYEYGQLSAYRASYAFAFGGLRSITDPVPGNHEYYDPAGNAAGYRQYFGRRAIHAGHTWYSYNLGGWHLIALDSNCPQIGGCGAQSPEGRWLHADLAAHASTQCTLAYWHHPLQSSGEYAHDATTKSYARPLWQAVAAGGVDVVLNGHDHLYERFAPRNGIRQFTVGTGGRSHYPVTSVAAGSRRRIPGRFGVLSLDLAPTRYHWAFTAITGTVLDHGSAACG